MKHKPLIPLQYPDHLWDFRKPVLPFSPQQPQISYVLNRPTCGSDMTTLTEFHGKIFFGLWKTHGTTKSFCTISWFGTS